MSTIKLYRPVGLKEMELIIKSGFKEFPPRLPEQPIFYPVLNLEYARQIAREWNTLDIKSGYCGFVTSFDIDKDYISQFEVKTVGSEMHKELWIPSDRLSEFNSRIAGKIEVVDVFYGSDYTGKNLTD